MAIKSKEKTAAQLKEFGFTLALILLLITLAFIAKDNRAAPYTFSLAAILILAAITAPISLRKIEIFWTALGIKIGAVMTYVVLTILFVVVITPLAVVLRLFGKQFLELRLDKNIDSYWIPVDNSNKSSRHFLPY